MHDTPLAIIGMACRLPGANNLDEYWRLLREGRCAVGELPPERLNRSLHYDPSKDALAKSYTTIGAVVAPRAFERSECPIPDEWIASSDGAHLGFLEVAAEACRHGGLDPFAMRGRRAGIYVGHTRGTVVSGEIAFSTMIEHSAGYLRDVEGFHKLSRKEQEAVVKEIVEAVRRDYPHRDAAGGPFLEAHRAASLVAEAFGWDGPAMSINAACASSLIALALAARALRRGYLELAVVGGASHLKFDSLVLFSKAQSVSATGSRPFDESADGLVASEGYVAVVIKTLDRAVAEGDTIQAVVRGLGVASDGRGKSLWAPRKEGQVLAIRRAHGKGTGAGQLQYVEAHATSTQLGDATEAAALAEALADSFPAGTQIPIGSVKSNIGHTLETAGMAGLVKTVLAMQHGVIPPTIGLERLNTKIDWQNAPFQVCTQAIVWPRPGGGLPRRAAVNAFGIGGLNVHVVLEEYLPHESGRARADVAPPAVGANHCGREEVAIVGMAAILPGANSAEAFWRLLQAGEVGLGPVPPDYWNPKIAWEPGARRPGKSPLAVGGFVRDYTYDWKRHKIPPKQLAQADPLQFMLLDVVDRALADAGFDVNSQRFPRATTGVFVGTEFLGEFAAHLQVGIRLPEFHEYLTRALLARGLSREEIGDLISKYTEVFLRHMPAILDETGSFTSSTLASRITKTFDLMGGAAALDAGNASGHAALLACIDTLVSRDCDVMICAAGQRALGLCNYERLALRGMLASDPLAGPWDAASTGIVPADGAAVLVLKRLEDARRDGDRVRGIILGIGVARQSNPRQSLREAMRRALANAEVRPEQVAGVEAVASGISHEDEAELAAVAEVYAQADRAQPPVVSQVTGQIGYASGAAGLISTVKAVQEIEHGRVPAAVGVRNLADYVSRLPHSIQLALNPEPLKSDESGRLFVGVNGLGGDAQAYHIILERAERVPPSLPRNDAAVVPRRATTESSLPSRDQARPKLAFLFPGQGSQYAGMLRPLVEDFAPAREALEQMEQVVARLGFPEPRDVLWGNQSRALGREVWLTQYAILLADALVLRALAALDIEPDVVAGHSFGEFAALFAAGAWSFEACARATRARCDAVESTLSARGVMVASNAPAEEVEQACREVGGKVYLCNHNAPRQSVLGGEAHAVAQALELLHKRGFQSTPLPVPRPYHSPLMGETCELFARALREIRVMPPGVPILSSVTNRYVAEPEEIRANLARQLVMPVRYVALIQRLAEDGVRVFVEVGPESILTRLHRQILGDDAYACIACDDQRKGGLSSLTAVQSLLAKWGCTIPNRRQGPRWWDLDPPSAARGSQEGSVEGTREQARTEKDSISILPPVSAPVAQAPPAPPKHGVLILTGSRERMGWDQGRHEAARIRAITRRYADLAGMPGDTLPAIDHAVECVDTYFAPGDLDELAAIARGAGVLEESIVAHHLLAYPDLGAGGCAHFAIRASVNGGGRLLHAANEDLPLGLTVRDCLHRNLQFRAADGELAYLTFCIAGQAGGINGINEAGLAVTSSMLLDLPHEGESPNGRLHGMIVRRLLACADSIDASLDLLRGERGTGGWGVCLSDWRSDRICYVEYDGANVRTRHVLDRIVAANHSLLHEPRRVVPRHSCRRLARLQELLDGLPETTIDVERVKAAFRDRFDAEKQRTTPHPTMNTVRRVDNQFTVIFDPAAGFVWYAGSGTGHAHVDEFQRLDLDELFKNANRGRHRPPARKAPSRCTGPLPCAVPPGTPAARPAQEECPAQNPTDPILRVCQRFVLRAEEAAFQPGGGTAFAGPVLILGTNPVAMALRDAIRSQGQRAAILPSLDQPDAALALLDKAWQSVAFPHLVLATPHDRPSNDPLAEASWLQRRSRGVLGPFFVAQRWLQRIQQAGLLAEASITACTCLGGDFGLRGEFTSIEGGGLSGLVKDLRLEISGDRYGPFRARVIDFSRDEAPAAVARWTLDELTAANAEVEVGYRQGRRLVLRQYAQDVQTADGADPPGGGTWIVTGGARGVTALVALELGRRLRCRVRLLGSSPAPDIPDSWRKLSADDVRDLRTAVCKEAVADGESPLLAWQRVEKAMEIDRNLRAFSAAGVEATYHPCDIADRLALAGVVGEIRRADGTIQGVLHGAGFEKSVRFEKKTREMVERTFRAKVDGAANLMHLLDDAPPRFFVAFGSTSGRFGSIGQADYCAANDMLAKLVDWYRARRTECRAMCFHWTAWNEVGMAVRPEIKAALEQRGITFLPPAEGVAYVMEELLGRLPEGEVVITDWERHLQSLPPGAVAKSRGAPVPSPSVSRGASSLPSQCTKTLQTPPGNVVARFIPRLVSRPVPPPQAVAAAHLGGTIIIGANPLALALRERVTSQGHAATVVANDRSVEWTVREIEKAWKDGPRPIMVLTTGRDDAARLERVEDWAGRRLAGSIVPYWAIERWIRLLEEKGLTDQARLLAVVNLGGDFGLASAVPAPEGGGTIGLLKAVAREFSRDGNGIRVKVVDAPQDEPVDQLAGITLQELVSDHPEIEVAFSGDQRRVVELAAHSADQLELSTEQPQGTWLVSGGARGVTAVAALHLGRRFGLRLHLLGSSPPPQIEPAWRDLSASGLADLKRQITREALDKGNKPLDAWQRVERDLEMDRNLRAYRQAGVTATYHPCDVANPDALARTLDTIRAADGPIEGIIHGAGFERASRFARKDPRLVEKTIAVKVDGARNLMAATRNDPIRWFVAFGSISGRFGGVGQTDYCLANGLVAKLVDRYRRERSGCRAATIDWHSWDEVGMAVRPESRHVKSLARFVFMPTREGTAHLENELLAGLPSCEVVLTDPDYRRRYYKDCVSGGGAAAPSLAEQVPEGEGRRRTGLPLMASVQSWGPGNGKAEVLFDPLHDVFLAQHRFKGRPLLPLVIGMEAMAQAVAAMHAGEETPVGWRNVSAENPLRFLSDQATLVRVHMEPADGGTACRLTSDFRNRAGTLMQADRLHMRGIVLVEKRTMPASRPMGPPPALGALRRARPVSYRDDLVIYHGPVFRALRTIDIRESQCEALLVAPSLAELAGARSQGGWIYSPVVLDASFYACGLHFWLTTARGILIPRAIRSVVLGRLPMPGEDCVVTATAGKVAAHTADYDFQVRGADGAMILDVAGFESAIVPRGTDG